jgi:hypothetical protein
MLITWPSRSHKQHIRTEAGTRLVPGAASWADAQTVDAVQPGKIVVRRGHQPGGESHCRVELGTGVISAGVCRTRERTMTRQTVQGGEGRCALLKTTASAGVACQLQLRKSTSLATRSITMERFACSLFQRLCASYRTKVLAFAHCSAVQFASDLASRLVVVDGGENGWIGTRISAFDLPWQGSRVNGKMPWCELNLWYHHPCSSAL